MNFTWYSKLIVEQEKRKERLLREINFHFSVYSKAGAGNMFFQSDKHSQVKRGRKTQEKQEFLRVMNMRSFSFWISEKT